MSIVNLRLTIVIDTLGKGGLEHRCVRLIQGLNAQGYSDIQLILIDDVVAYKEVFQTSAQITIIGRKPYGKSLFKTLCKLRKLIKAFKPDVIQAWGNMSQTYVNMVTPCFKGKKVFVGVANCFGRSSHPFYRFCFDYNVSKVDYVVGNSQTGLDAYNIPPQKACLIYNGIDKEEMPKDKNYEVKHQLGIDDNMHVITMVARFSSVKDYATYFKVAKRIIAQRNDVVFLAVGSGGMLERYQEELANYSDRIMLLGQRNDVGDILSFTDISVLCTYTEGISNSILESMQMELPIIANDGGGTPEIVEHEGNGFLFKQGDIDTLCKKINLLLNDDTLRLNMGRRSKEIVDNKFSLENMVNSFLTISK